MPRPKGTVRITGGESDKPVAPDDLWAKLDAVIATITPKPKPANAITAAEHARRMNISVTMSRYWLDKAVAKGLMEKGGTTSDRWYKVKERK